MKTKTNNFIVVFLCILSLQLYGQTWQWGKSGGSSASGQDNITREKIQTIVADTQGNTYTLSYIGGTDAVINGQLRETYNVDDTGRDILLCSYACDGSFRWSRVIGGWGLDFLCNMGIDSQNNIFVSVIFFRGYLEIPNSQAHIDAAVTLPISWESENTHKETLFLIKYNSNGVLQWYRTPQRSNISYIDAFRAGNRDLSVDPQGNIYMLCVLRNDVYCNGAYTVSNGVLDGNGFLKSTHILKYDTNGNFVSGTPLPIDNFIGGLYFPTDVFRFKRNHNNGKYYIVGGLYDNPITINGQVYTDAQFSKYVCAFDTDGTFLWIKHNNTTFSSYYDIFDIAFDDQNNIYYTGSGQNIAFDQNPPNSPIVESWNGQQFTPTTLPGEFTDRFRVLVKMDENGNNVWLTNGKTKSVEGGAEISVHVKNNEVFTGSEAFNFLWQNITNFNPNGGFCACTRASIARFDKNTGTLLSANFLPTTSGNLSGFTSLCSDSKGNIYGGGFLTSSINVNGTMLNSNGGPDDFFIAKFGSNDCNFLATAEREIPGIKSFPNPVQNKLTLTNNESISYELYDALGAKVKWGTLIANDTIAFDGLPNGMYLLQTKNAVGIITTEKIIKE